MTKVKYDYTEVKEQDRDFDDYEGPEPTRGVHTFKVVKCDPGKSKQNNPMITAIAVIEEGGKFDGWPGWVYLVQTEDSIWKTKTFTEGIGLTKPGDKKGAWDTDDAIGKTFRAKVKHETYNEEIRGKIGRILPKSKADEKVKSKKTDGKGDKKKKSGKNPF